jgi:hypothetical protein
MLAVAQDTTNTFICVTLSIIAGVMLIGFLLGRPWVK